MIKLSIQEKLMINIANSFPNNLAFTYSELIHFFFSQVDMRSSILFFLDSSYLRAIWFFFYLFKKSEKWQIFFLIYIFWYIQKLKISHFFIFIACHCLYFQLNHIHYEATMKILTKIHTFYHNKNLKLFLECGT